MEMDSMIEWVRSVTALKVRCCVLRGHACCHSLSVPVAVNAHALLFVASCTDASSTTGTCGSTWAVPPAENLFVNPNAAIPALNRPSVYNVTSPFSGNIAWLQPGACVDGVSRQIVTVVDDVRPAASAVDITNRLCFDPPGAVASATPSASVAATPVTATPSPSPGFDDYIVAQCALAFRTGEVAQDCCTRRRTVADCNGYYQVRAKCACAVLCLM